VSTEIKGLSETKTCIFLGAMAVAQILSDAVLVTVSKREFNGYEFTGP